MKVWLLQDWILIEFCILFFIIKYSKFNDDIGSQEILSTYFLKILTSFKTSVVKGEVPQPSPAPHPPSSNTIIPCSVQHGLDLMGNQIIMANLFLIDSAEVTQGILVASIFYTKFIPIYTNNSKDSAFFRWEETNTKILGW